MPYGFAQRVVKATPDAVLRTARLAAREAGLVTGPTRDPNGAFGERYLPLIDGRTTGRLWVWPLASGLSVTYLGFSDDSALARAITPSARKRLRRKAEWLIERVGARPQAERTDMRLAA